MHNRSKGSLTIEAIISFTVFISLMFLLLSMVKFAVTDITLSYAASETAKQLATAAYPVQLLNDLENDVTKAAGANSGPVTLQEGLAQAVNNTTIDVLYSTKAEVPSSAVSGGAQNILSLFAKQGGASLWDLLRDDIGQLKTTSKVKVAAHIFDSFIENSFVDIDKNKLTLEVVKLPQNDIEWKNHQFVVQYVDMGLEPGRTFMQDDVVIAIKYRYPMVLPFLPKINVNMRQIAVEHGWIHGGNGTITAANEGIDLSTIVDSIKGTSPVYITPNGECFHLQNCPTLSRSKVINNINTAEAEAMGRRACKVCNP